MTVRRRAYLRLAGAGLAGLAGCVGSGSGGTRTVEMTDGLRFVPGTVAVAPGTVVEWTNAGSVEHTVTAYGERIPAGADYFASGGFESEAAARENLERGLIPADGSYRHAFEATGTYEYFCVPHEGSGMTGAVRVR